MDPDKNRPETEVDAGSEKDNLEPTKGVKSKKKKGGNGDQDKDSERKNKGSLLKKTEKGRVDGTQYIELEPTISEALKDTAVIAFGRMNPPTVGHEKLVNKVINEAISRGGVPLVYLSKTQDSDKNPLSYDQKLKYAQTFFGRKYIIKSKSRTIIDVAKELQNYDNLVVVVGSDRLREFDKLLNKYNGKDYTYKTLEVISAGDRDPDADGVSGMSASKMRQAAADDDFKSFSKGVPGNNKRIAQQLFDDVRDGMDLAEGEIDAKVESWLAERVANGKVDPLSPMGKSKLTGREVTQYYKSNPKAKQASKKQEVKLGIELALDLAGNMNYAKKEIDKIKKNLSKHPEVQKALIHANESTNHQLYTSSTFVQRLQSEDKMTVADKRAKSGYYKDDSPDGKLSKSTTAKRHAQFVKQTKMADDDPEAYKPAPGDATAKTKPSKHTNKFKAMFGEANYEKAYLKRPHQLLRADKAVNFDYRFKMYGKARDEERKAKELELQRAQIAADIKKESDPCWDGYKQVGTKKGRNGNQVPNCVKEVTDLADAVEFVFENGNPEKSLKKKAAATGMPLGILRKVFDRGVAAWKTGHRPGTTPVQWGLARVNSFATKSKGTWGKADKDLAAKVESYIQTESQ